MHLHSFESKALVLQIHDLPSKTYWDPVTASIKPPECKPWCHAHKKQVSEWEGHGISTILHTHCSGNCSWYKKGWWNGEWLLWHSMWYYNSKPSQGNSLETDNSLFHNLLWHLSDCSSIFSFVQPMAVNISGELCFKVRQHKTDPRWILDLANARHYTTVNISTANWKKSCAATQRNTDLS